jgi:catechol 2,3-dioxygenase-like lactoylglutathione lyase family enzyme
MLGSSDLVAFVATADLERARDFYGGTLGLRLTEETPFACVFDANGTVLRVTPVGELASAPYTVLGWSVADVTAIVEDLRSKGVQTERYVGIEQDALGVWVTPGGDKVAWFKDPDGNTLSLTEAAA